MLVLDFKKLAIYFLCEGWHCFQLRDFVRVCLVQNSYVNNQLFTISIFVFDVLEVQAVVEIQLISVAAGFGQQDTLAKETDDTLSHQVICVIKTRRSCECEENNRPKSLIKAFANNVKIGPHNGVLEYCLRILLAHVHHNDGWGQHLVLTSGKNEE